MFVPTVKPCHSSVQWHNPEQGWCSNLYRGLVRVGEAFATKLPLCHDCSTLQSCAMPPVVLLFSEGCFDGIWWACVLHIFGEKHLWKLFMNCINVANCSKQGARHRSWFFVGASSDLNRQWGVDTCMPCLVALWVFTDVSSMLMITTFFCVRRTVSSHCAHRR